MARTHIIAHCEANGCKGRLPYTEHPRTSQSALKRLAWAKAYDLAPYTPTHHG